MRYLFAVAVAVVLATAGRAEALTIGFSFSDDPTSSIAGRTHIGGTVAGIMYGLQDDAASVPTAIRFTSDLSGLGIVGDTFSTSSLTSSVAGVISIRGGVVDPAFNFTFNSGDGVGGFFQFAFNIDGFENRLMWNGGTTPIVGIGNNGDIAA